jgi:cyclopropane-fatty-acyl-phospholipid synthase
VKEFIQDILGIAGISINGSNPWDIIVHHPKWYKNLAGNVDLALGESYMENWWDCQNLDQFFYRVIQMDIEKVILNHPRFWQYALKRKWFSQIPYLVNFQSKKRAMLVAKKHYDIGNDLYTAMLDKRMVYTCAYWEGANNLEEAQEKKLMLCCQKLDLKSGMRVLDIGCGWGSFAKYAAERHNVSVVGVSISKEQIDMGTKLCSGLPVTLRMQDYRDLLKNGEKFDRVVSLGMFEHVGYRNYPIYFDIVSHCLKENGLFLLQTIGSNVSDTTIGAWINKYIFPNGQLPSIAQIGRAIEHKFVMEDWHNFGVFYDKTLLAWHHNFNQQWDNLKSRYDERFRRMWNYYLLSCAGAFRGRMNQLWQIVLSKKGLEKGYQRT